MSAGIETKSAVTVAEMARMCGLSRARFYQLKGTTFPEPSRDSDTGRPFYNEEQQRVCLEVRRRNCGINGKPVLFYSRGNKPITAPARNRKPKPTKPVHGELIDALRSLGLVSVTAQQADVVIKELFPSGIANIDHGEVVRAVFIHIQRHNSTDNVG